MVSKYIIALLAIAKVSMACFGGSSGQACCPQAQASSCGPSVPQCGASSAQSYASAPVSSYALPSSGGYPRPLGYQTSPQQSYNQAPQPSYNQAPAVNTYSSSIDSSSYVHEKSFPAPSQGYNNGPQVAVQQVGQSQGYNNGPSISVQPSQGYNNGPSISVQPSPGYNNGPASIPAPQVIPSQENYQNKPIEQPTGPVAPAPQPQILPAPEVHEPGFENRGSEGTEPVAPTPAVPAPGYEEKTEVKPEVPAVVEPVAPVEPVAVVEEKTTEVKPEPQPGYEEKTEVKEEVKPETPAVVEPVAPAQGYEEKQPAVVEVVAPVAPSQGYEDKQVTVPVTQPEKPKYDATAENVVAPVAPAAGTDYADETNEGALGDEACSNHQLRTIIEAAVKQSQDNLEIAKIIESESSKAIGGRFNSIVSSSEFGYVNFYSANNCVLRTSGKHVLLWQD
uniref:Ground-like domain-containing protein n=1 Tax=Rhabditophanes sp. KR3021 TaxID=114890 RepID=A0AC35TS43_9BILA